jgi:hypothetical protein
MANLKTVKFQKAKDTLPDDLKPVYEDLVGGYAFHTNRLYGRGYVAYEVLAALVQDGWRCVPEQSPNDHVPNDG